MGAKRGGSLRGVILDEDEDVVKFLVKFLCLGEDEDADEEGDLKFLTVGSLLEHFGKTVGA
eukprot:2369401-Heterocapsa_arctica.AAC.1